MISEIRQDRHTAAAVVLFSYGYWKGETLIHVVRTPIFLVDFQISCIVNKLRHKTFAVWLKTQNSAYKLITDITLNSVCWIQSSAIIVSLFRCVEIHAMPSSFQIQLVIIIIIVFDNATQKQVTQYSREQHVKYVYNRRKTTENYQ